MKKGQIEIVAQINSIDNGFSSVRQIPCFLVRAFCFQTAKSIVKDMFEGQNISGQMRDFNGNIKTL